MNKRYSILLILFLFLGQFLIAQETKKVIHYFDKSQNSLKSITHVLKSDTLVFHGQFKEYYRSQRLLIAGQYQLGKPVGKWSYFYENGFRKMEAFLDSSEQTYWKYYFENDSLKMEGFISDRNKQGDWVYYYEDGSVKNRGEYRDGKKHGLWEHYYPDGEIKAVANYSMGEGTYTEYYYKGGIQRTGKTKNNYSEGIWTYFYPDGSVEAKGMKHNGLKDGEWQYFYNSGELSGKGLYTNGDQTGDWIFYHQNGKVSSKGTIVNGKKDGHWNLYNSDGGFKGEATFILGNGKYREYYEGGSLKVEGDIVNGKSNGKWVYYYNDGSIEGTCDFIEGRGQYLGYYHDSKTLQMKGVIENGDKVGVWVLYDENGQEAGYYKTIHAKDDSTSYADIDQLEDVVEQKNIIKKDTSKSLSQLPEYVKPKKPKKSKSHNRGIRKIYYFKPTRHEYQSVIVNANPLGVVYGNIPVSLEYHFQDRLGYEFMYTLQNAPLFIPSSKVNPDHLWKKGGTFEIKQKLYHPTKSFGHVYFGHMLGYTNALYGSRVLSEIDKQLHELKIENKEFNYSLFVGNRLGTYYFHGLVFDIYAGLTSGYRLSDQNFSNDVEKYNEVFSPVKTSKLVLKPFFGFTFGYIF